MSQDQLDLPGLQRRLTDLPPGQRLAVSISDARRLFGVNGAAAETMVHFAKGHGCTMQATPSAIIFISKASE